MLFIGIFALSFLILNSHENPTLEILNGRENHLGKFQFPSIVSLQVKASNQHFCSGTILDERHILSAAHCFEMIPLLSVHANLLQIVTGDLKIGPTNPSPTRQTVELKRIAIHPDFSSITLQNDIAVMSLVKALDISNFTKPAELSTERPEVGTNCFAAGWESNKQKDVVPFTTSVVVQDKDACKIIGSNGSVKHTLTDLQLCTGNLASHNNSCQNDSGGPLYCNDKLVGIASYNPGCTRPSHPGIYVNIANYKNWTDLLLKETDRSAILISTLGLLHSVLQANSAFHSYRFSYTWLVLLTNVYNTILK